MELLPKDLENMIIDYKHQLDHQGKLQSVLKDLVEYVPEKRKYIRYDYNDDPHYPALLIHNQKDTRWGKINLKFWESEECKKYITDSRIEHDVSYYAIFTNDGQTWWEY